MTHKFHAPTKTFACPLSGSLRLTDRVVHANSRYMAKSLLSKHLSKLGRRGGNARMTTMTAEERRASATKASKAAAKARTLKAKKRKD